MNKDKLTRQEALKQGYTKCTNTIDQWCYLTDIKDLTEIDFENDTWWLADKKSKAFQINEDFLSELLSERIGEDEYEETGRDNDDISLAISSLDFSETTKMINEKLQEFNYYNLTRIELTQ